MATCDWTGSQRIAYVKDSSEKASVAICLVVCVFDRELNKSDLFPGALHLQSDTIDNVSVECTACSSS
jgi:hypothetical protein